MTVYPSTQTPWVLITGASAGIGEVFAKHFAQDGYNLVLVARSSQKLQVLAKHLEGAYKIRALSIEADLAKDESPKVIFEEINQQGINLYGLINNAGCGAGGEFIQVRREQYLNIIDLNIRSLVEMTHLFLPGMIERKKGFIINVSSTASFQPMPYSSVYAASKAFVTSFSEALWLETQSTGVRVLNLCPGLTKTDFGTTAGMRDFHTDPIAQYPEQVVETALKALKKNNPTAISGLRNQFLVLLERFVPHRFLLWASLFVQNSRRII